jgi:hypothetical protein
LRVENPFLRHLPTIDFHKSTLVFCNFWEHIDDESNLFQDKPKKKTKKRLYKIGAR